MLTELLSFKYNPYFIVRSERCDVCVWRGDVAAEAHEPVAVPLKQTSKGDAFVIFVNRWQLLLLGDQLWKAA